MVAGRGVFLAALAVCMVTEVSAQWYQQTSGTTSELTGVSFNGPSHGVIVGYNGTVLYTSTGGDTWTTGTSGTTHILRDVHMVSQTMAVAVGDTGTVIRSTDGGQTWATGVSGTTASLRAVRLSDELHGVAVGGDSFEGHSIILRTTDGGQTWQQQDNPLEGYFYSILRSVDMFDSLRGVAVGSGAYMAGDTIAGVALYTQDGGRTWSIREVHPASFNLLAVAAGDDSMAVAVGEFGGIYRTADAGDTWEQRTGGGGLDTTLYSVSFGSLFVGTAVGVRFDDGQWPVPIPYVVRTIDGGRSWTTHTIDVDAMLVDVWFSDVYRGTIVGTGGIILRTVNGGGPGPVVNLAVPSVNFGSVLPSASRDTTLTGVVSNTGNAVLELTAIHLTGADASAFSFAVPPALPLVLQPGDSATLGLRFAPQHAGPHTAAVEFEGSVLGAPALALSGFGGEGAVAIDFGPVPVGAAEDTTIILVNTERFPLFLDGIPVPAGPFSVTAVDPALPAEIPPGNTLRVQVRFAPASGGPASSTLAVELRAADGALYPMPHILTGEGTTQTSVGDDSRQLPLRAHPNPSAGTTLLSFDLAAQSHVRIDITDAQGRLVRRLAPEPAHTGACTVAWDGRDDRGVPCPAGVYNVTVCTDNGAESVSVVRVR